VFSVRTEVKVCICSAGTVYVGFAVDKVDSGTGFLPVLRFVLTSSILPTPPLPSLSYYRRRSPGSRQAMVLLKSGSNGHDMVHIFVFMVRHPLMGQGLLIFEASLSHSDTPLSVGLLWTDDRSVTETSTRQHTTLTTDRHPCSQWVLNPQSQQASGRRPTP
jgi:hypothetical protein